MRWARHRSPAGIWSQAAARAKQKQHHEVPLSAPARALLARIREEQAAQNPNRPLGEFVFPSSERDRPSRRDQEGWATLCKAAGIEDLRLHDLRHSYASALVVVRCVLAADRRTAGPRLARDDGTIRPPVSADPQRAAAEKIGALIENAAEPPAPDKVVPLERGRS